MRGKMSERKTIGSQDALDKLLPQVRDLIIQARNTAKRTIDVLQVVTNFEIGRCIVEEEQHGAERAQYGKALLKELSAALKAEFGTGFSRTNLEYMRRFYLGYRERALQKSQTLSGRLDAPSKSQTLSGKSLSPPKSRALPRETGSGFTLSWSHYLFLMAIKTRDERSFYEIEATTQGWSLREMRRQFNSGLYERLALSRDKDGVRELAKKGQLVTTPEQSIKDPYVLEFLGLREETRYSERELETAIIDKLEHFLLELGKGFLFEARQKRFTFDDEHFFVDLVFYNRLLTCYVLIDLKIGELTHQDLGQMQMYVNYYDRYVKRDSEHPTVGIILCRKKTDALVELTLPDGNIYASEYQLYLPSKEELRQKLIDWAEELER
jgi:predicted nuclease of restriction endonuclease-like (RecB) superfamily